MQKFRFKFEKVKFCIGCLYSGEKGGIIGIFFPFIDILAFSFFGLRENKYLVFVLSGFFFAASLTFALLGKETVLKLHMFFKPAKNKLFKFIEEIFFPIQWKTFFTNTDAFLYVLY